MRLHAGTHLIKMHPSVSGSIKANEADSRMAWQSARYTILYPIRDNPPCHCIGADEALRLSGNISTVHYFHKPLSASGWLR